MSSRTFFFGAPRSRQLASSARLHISAVAPHNSAANFVNRAFNRERTLLSCIGGVSGRQIFLAENPFYHESHPSHFLVAITH